MGLDDYNKYSEKAVEKFGRHLLEQRGELACNEAEKIEDLNLTDGTKKTYKSQIRDVINNLNEANPNIKDVVDYMSEVDKTGSTKKMMLMAMKKYYHTIGEKDKGEDMMLMANDRGIDDGEYSDGMDVDQWVTEEEVDVILENLCPEETEDVNRIGTDAKSWVISIEHKAIVASLYYTACRVGEVVLLEVDDFYFDRNEVEVYRLKKDGKEPKRDMIYVPQEYLDIVKDYMNTYNINDGKLFSYTERTIQNRINEIEELYNFAFGQFQHCDNLTPHKFRHGRITAIANASDLDSAGEYVNHADPSTTKAYRHMATEKQKEILPETNVDEEEDESEVDKLLNELEVDSVDELKDKLDD